jgi:hypothetical protein
VHDFLQPRVQTLAYRATRTVVAVTDRRLTRSHIRPPPALGYIPSRAFIAGPSPGFLPKKKTEGAGTEQSGPFGCNRAEVQTGGPSLLRAIRLRQEEQLAHSCCLVTLIAQGTALASSSIGQPTDYVSRMPSRPSRVIGSRSQASRQADIESCAAASRALLPVMPR